MKTFSLVLVLFLSSFFIHAQEKRVPLNPLANRTRPHLDHTPYFKGEFTDPREVTKKCLTCHKNAAKEVMQTPHFSWTSGDVERKGKVIKTGKKNNLNNFCISVVGNWGSCTKCHTGYGWEDNNYDFKNESNVDCLVCHDGSGTYAKGVAGYPVKSVDLGTVARSVRTPKRDNCGSCHFNGGGGMGVKHGDLDDSLLNPSEEVDVHMGRLDFACSDCHETKNHFVPGKVNATYTDVTHAVRFDCSKCHTEKPHKDHRLNFHVASVACQTCHIPNFARKYPTKMTWNWSSAGDGEREKRENNPHTYMKIKGDFKYEEEVVPEYAWFNGMMDRYFTGDKIPDKGLVKMNNPRGKKGEKDAKIWPFKIHRGSQPFDPVNRIIIPPITSGKDGFWKIFDWPLAIKNGAKANNLPYSGQFGFTKTIMYWPINHMVAPAKKALGCTSCHGKDGILDWKALGYEGDPVGGRKNER